MTINGHIVMFSVSGWGHVRPLVAFACRIIQQRPASDIGITIFVSGNIIDKTDIELARYFAPGDESKGHIRIISVQAENSDPFELIFGTAGACVHFYPSLYREERVTCLSSGKTFEPWPKPTLVISDVFLDVVSGIRAIDNAVTILGWSPGNNSATFRMLGPEELGGTGNIGAKAIVEAEKTGKSVQDVENYLNFPEEGDLLEIPGLPPLYDFELIPQKKNPAMDGVHGRFTKISYNFVRAADGLILPSTRILEIEALDAWKKWQNSLGKEVYVIGPLLSINDGSKVLEKSSKENERAASDKGPEIEAFLDKALQEHGEHSLIYISFGSFFWPKHSHIWAFLDVLIEQRVPFIFAHASPHAVIPDQLVQKVQESGIGLLSKWAPQQLILAHKATGWFVSHCGQNSFVESLAEGVPLLAWPLFADQPYNAAILSLRLNVGYQLMEARTGTAGLKALKRGIQPTGTDEALRRETLEIIEKMRTADGKLKRQNAQNLQAQMKAAWDEDGEAVTELKRLLENNIPRANQNIQFSSR
ncbi:glycosyltransferase family 1 protein [Sphaerobolus stellatus SS14]|uniref:Unplaced genomic scaffold SPHSTscaffold_33, whole genome shotgun sequence n=1 Tax=Sphaerobolus stellatus (strain SS14) TaxID=990650 RepID=A0A0C9UTW5_SPHS4|nr:glycosyltransferase family 1 protein [Sphaerobolus stellatus SS14]